MHTQRLPPATPSQSSCYMARADQFNTMALDTNSPEIKVNLAVMLTELSHRIQTGKGEKRTKTPPSP